MNLIAAVDNNWNIGNDNNLLFKIPEDLKMFKTLTTNCMVVMGHNTFKSLPCYPNPLPNRTNLILSREYQQYKDSYYATIPIFLNSLGSIEISMKDVFVIGGEQIYEQLLPYCKIAYITKCFQTFSANKKLKNLELETNWKLCEASELKTHKDLTYKFLKFKNDNVKIYNPDTINQ